MQALGCRRAGGSGTRYNGRHCCGLRPAAAVAGHGRMLAARRAVRVEGTHHDEHDAHARRFRFPRGSRSARRRQCTRRETSGARALPRPPSALRWFVPLTGAALAIIVALFYKPAVVTPKAAADERLVTEVAAKEELDKRMEQLRKKASRPQKARRQKNRSAELDRMEAEKLETAESTTARHEG